MTPLHTETTPQAPQINTPLPGPKTQALIEADSHYISPSYTRGYPLAIEKGVGAMVMDPDGNWFLDFCAGIAVCATGHSHPKIVDAITQQAQQFIHMSGTDFYYPNMVALAKKLDETSGMSSPTKTFFANSGTEAIEGAIKLARYHTKRTGIIGFYRSFHGRTFGAMSVSASKSVHRSHFQPLMSAVFHGHYPDAYRPMLCPNGSPEDEAQACLDFIEKHLFKMVVRPEEVAAIICEPIQGEGGYVVPPSNWLPGLRKICDQHGILLIMDEVQSGMGRTGKMWAYEYNDFEPDIICSAKGIASGMPLGAIIAKSSVMTWPPGTHATTFGGNPVSCAAALATIELLESELMANASAQGERLLDQLNALVNDFDCLGSARGRGLMLGLEVITDKASKGRNYELRNKIVDRCFEKGLLLLGCGENTIRFSPPLIITNEQVDIAARILREALQELS